MVILCEIINTNMQRVYQLLCKNLPWLWWCLFFLPRRRPSMFFALSNHYFSHKLLFILFLISVASPLPDPSLGTCVGLDSMLLPFFILVWKCSLSSISVPYPKRTSHEHGALLLQESLVDTNKERLHWQDFWQELLCYFSDSVLLNSFVIHSVLWWFEILAISFSIADLNE